jgi:hypothetical protein
MLPGDLRGFKAHPAQKWAPRGARVPSITKVLNPKTVADLTRALFVILACEGRTLGADLGLTEHLEQVKQFVICQKTILGANTRRGKCLH